MAVLAVVFAVSGCGKVFADREREAREAALLAEMEKKKAEEEKKKLEAQLKEQNAKIERLLAELSNAKDEAQRAALQKQLEDLQMAGKKQKTMAAPPKKECKCEPTDPLCSCL